MSVNTSSAFNIDGMLSGLKTGDIITKLLAADQAPITQMTNKKSDVSARDAAYQDIKAQVVKFQNALSTLLRPSNVNAKTTTLSTPGFVTATSNADAINGSFSRSEIVKIGLP